MAKTVVEKVTSPNPDVSIFKISGVLGYHENAVLTKFFGECVKKAMSRLIMDFSELGSLGGGCAKIIREAAATGEVVVCIVGASNTVHSFLEKTGKTHIIYESDQDSARVKIAAVQPKPAEAPKEPAAGPAAEAEPGNAAQSTTKKKDSRGERSPLRPAGTRKKQEQAEVLEAAAAELVRPVFLDRARVRNQNHLGTLEHEDPGRLGELAVVADHGSDVDRKPSPQRHLPGDVLSLSRLQDIAEDDLVDLRAVDPRSHQSLTESDPAKLRRGHSSERSIERPKRSPSPGGYINVFQHDQLLLLGEFCYAMS